MLSLSTALSIKQRFLEQALKQSQSRTQGLKMAARVNRNETDIVIIQNKRPKDRQIDILRLWNDYILIFTYRMQSRA